MSTFAEHVAPFQALEAHPRATYAIGPVAMRQVAEALDAGVAPDPRSVSALYDWFWSTSATWTGQADRSGLRKVADLLLQASDTCEGPASLTPTEALARLARLARA